MPLRLSALASVIACTALLTLLSLQAAGAGANNPRAAAAAPTLTRETLTAAAALRDRALRDGEAWSLVESLVTEVGSRAAGTPGDRAGVEWALRTATRLGFRNVRPMEVIVPRWSRGTAELAVMSPFPQAMPVLALGGSVGTPDEGLRADAVRVRDFDELRALRPDEVAGKIVFFSNRMQRTQDSSGYGKAVQIRSGAASAAAALGAVGVVIRSVSTSNHRLPHTGTMTYNIAHPRIPAVAVSNPDADALERMFASGKPVSLHMKVTARDLPQVRSANVIAEVPGTTRPDEIVLIGAHLDSWDPGVGAVDDGAGVAIALAAAKLLQGMQPARTIRVVLFANEEFGLSGANTYALAESASLTKHVAAMEADLGAGPVWRLDTNLPATSMKFGADLLRLLTPLGVKAGKNDANGGADITPLRKRGVPIIAPQLDATTYFDVHHSADDTLDKVDASALRQSVAVFAVSAYLAAQADGDLGRLPADDSAR